MASCAGVFVHYLFTHDVSALFTYSANVYFLSILLAIFGTVVPSYLMTDGIKKIGSRNTAITATLGPVWTIILAHFVLAEKIDYIQIVGTVLVLGGVVVASLKKD